MNTKSPLFLLAFLGLWFNGFSTSSWTGTDKSSVGTINTSIVWNSPCYTTNDITVGSTGELTIQSTTMMFSNLTKIVLEPGAKLVIENATLEPCGSNLMWGGIVAKGDNSIDQNLSGSINASQTRVFVENSTIQYAISSIGTSYNGNSILLILNIFQVEHDLYLLVQKCLRHLTTTYPF